jgi:uncharacterized cupin superfamily protein
LGQQSVGVVHLVLLHPGRSSCTRH